MIELCSYNDINYLAKQVALYHSLECHLGNDFTLHVLALDDVTFNWLGRRNFRRMTVTRLGAFEDESLKKVRLKRTRVEYYFTLTAAWVKRVIDHYQLENVAYCDADMFCFHNLRQLYDEVGSASIAIVPHRFAPEYAWRNEANGPYNVSWTYFRNDPIGRMALDVWRQQCLDWCSLRSENGLFGDQGFIRNWPQQYGAHVVRHIGVGLAPWNQLQYRYHVAGDAIMVESDPLLIYHAHEFCRHERGVYTYTHWPLSDFVVKHVYEPYCQAIEEAEDEIRTH